MKRTRRTGVWTAVIVSAVLTLGVGIFGCGATEMERNTAVFFEYFDTQTEIIAYGDKADFERKVQGLEEKLAYYHKLYDIYESYEGINNIKTINDNAGIAPVKVEVEIIELLEFSKEMYAATSGKNNIAMGSVLSIWHDYREVGTQNPKEATLPTIAELQSEMTYCDIEKIKLDKQNMTVFLDDANMSVDVGSIGKGYATQKIAEYAKEIGLENALINIGGNICAIGERSQDVPWTVGIQNPDLAATDPYIKKVAVSNRCVVTSGDYQRYYEVEGKRYCHIINPDTLMPAEYFSSVSVIAEDSGIADAVSTALFNMSLEEGQELVNTIDDLEAMWIFSDGKIVYSKGFETYLVE